MKATCNVGMIDQWDQLLIWSAFEVAISFAQVNVDFYRILACRHRECLVQESIPSPVTMLRSANAWIHHLLPCYDRSVVGPACMGVITEPLFSNALDDVDAFNRHQPRPSIALSYHNWRANGPGTN